MDYNEIYNQMNNNGLGYSVGNETDNINELTGIGELIKKAETADDVAVYQDGDTTVIVGDSNGPWAVDATMYSCACCGTETIGGVAIWHNGEPYCKECVELGCF